MTPPLDNLFALIDQIAADLTTGTPASLQALRTTDLAALQGHISNVLQQRALIGTTAARLEVTQNQLAARRSD